MPALPQCDAFAFIYDQNGDPAPDILVVLKSVLDASRNPILLSPKTTVTDSAGSFHFTLPELARVTIAARASGLWNCPDGRAFTVPPGPSGELVPDFSIPPSTNVEPPLIYLDDVLSIPKATATQDGYLSAADYVAFLAGATSDMGVVSFNTRTGEVTLLSNDVLFALGYIPINKDGDTMNGPLVLPGPPTAANQATNKGYVDAHSIATIPGVAGTYPNPTSITVNAYGQVIAITRGTPDTTPPVISAVIAISITATGVTITWTTNEPADSQVEYGLSAPAYGTSTPLDSSPVTTHSVTITGLTASTLYHYRVKSRDTASNLATSADFTFTTTAAPDTTPPVISAVASSGLTATGATITWTTDEPSTSQVEYGTSTAYGSSTSLDTSFVTNHSVPITGLVASTLYHYRVKSHDAASNPATSADSTFTTSIAPDVTPPVISAVSSSGVTATAATVTWTTNESADSQVEYGPTTSYGNSTALDATMVTSHSVPLAGLTAGTLYHFRVKSRDVASNLQTSGDNTFMTSAVPVDLLTGLVSMWKMDETGTSTVRLDSAPAANHNDATPTVVTDVAGVQGRAGHVPGSGDRLTVNNNASLQTGPVSYMWALWVKFDAVGTHQQIIYKGGGGGDETYLYYYYAGPPVQDVFIYSAISAGPTYNSVTSASAGAPVVGQWYFIVIWHDLADNSINIQVNDGAVDSVVLVPPLTATSESICFGEQTTAYNAPLNGALDEIAFWKGRALPPAERTWLYNGGAGRPFSSWT
jgi:hypothetical protein